MTIAPSSSSPEVASLVEELRKLRRLGVRQAKLNDLPSLAALVSATGCSDLRSLLNAGIDAMEGELAREALDCSFGISDRYRWRSSPERRSMAAQVLSCATSETFRHGREKTLFREFAEQLRRLPAHTAVGVPADEQNPGNPSFSTVSHPSLLALGVRDVFVPRSGSEASENDRRNQAKEKAIDETPGGQTIRLVAMTGYTFLSSRGKFYDTMKKFLGRGGKLQVILSCEEAARRYMVEEEMKAFSSKLTQSMIGLTNLRKTWPGAVTARSFLSALPGTMLLTPQAFFYEPYLLTDETNRELLLFTSFELQFRAGSPGSHATQLLSGSFMYLWTRASDLSGEK